MYSPCIPSGRIMRTTLNLDEGLLENASELTGISAESSGSSAAVTRVPFRPLRREPPGGDPRLEAVCRGAHPVGSRATRSRGRSRARSESASTGVTTHHGRSSATCGTHGRGGGHQAVQDTSQDTSRETYRWFVGIDWAAAAHRVCVLDREGAVVSERSVEHTASALAEFMEARVRRTRRGSQAGGRRH